VTRAASWAEFERDLGHYAGLINEQA